MENNKFGTSSSQADWNEKNQIERIAPKSVVDLGAGEGKYCRLVKELIEINARL